MYSRIPPVIIAAPHLFLRPIGHPLRNRHTVHPPLIHRILLAALPAFVLGAIVLTSIWGDNGLIRRMELSDELRQANVELSRVQKENQRMIRQIKVIERDPIAAERAVAEELEWAVPGTTIYRFDEPTGE